MVNYSLIVGPPGTGKTTKLLSIVDGLIQGGTNPSHIGFVAFTRKAAHEARGRAMEKFSLSSEQLPWFRTLHSLAFQQVGANRGSVMGIRDYISLAQTLGLHLTIKGIAEDGTISGLSKGDRLFFMEGQARSQMKTLREYWEERPDEDIDFFELEQVANTLAAYKEANGKQDFTDIIDSFVSMGSLPPITSLVVDEAQDLSPLQWRMVEKLAETSAEVFVAGDDDQAIFRWAGACVDKFINLPGFQIILPQSYRVPALIQEVANRVISRVGNRIPKSWKPRDDSGTVQYVTHVDQIPGMDIGTWLLLARNTYLLDTYNQHCMQMGYLFESSGASPISGKTRQAIQLWERLTRGEQISIGQARIIYDLMATRERIAFGAKSKIDRAPDNLMVGIHDLARDFGLLHTDKPWAWALDKLDDREREYYAAAMARGEKLTMEPRIKVSTIHSVKGGEADNVVLQTDMAWRTWNEFETNPDDEHRVWYVGITRARQALYIIQPQTDKAYDI